MTKWPANVEALMAAQEDLGRQHPAPWTPSAPPDRLAIGGCWVCFPRGHTGPGQRGDPAWAAAVVLTGRRIVASRGLTGVAGAPYQPGLLALREGALLEAAVAALSIRPDVLLVNATGRDHPRRTGFALHLGAVLDLPTVGVTHRPLLATGEWPPDARGASATVRIDGEEVGAWLRTAAGRRPVCVTPGWRVDVATAVDVVRHSWCPRRTPEPLRQARRLARTLRVTVAGP